MVKAYSFFNVACCPVYHVIEIDSIFIFELFFICIKDRFKDF